MRVTHLGSTARHLQQLQTAGGRQADGQEKVSTGRRISRPSDDPAITGTVLQTGSLLRRTDQYQRNREDAAGWLGTIGQALTHASTRITVARTRTVEAVNGSAGQDQRNALATEIRSIANELRGLANERFRGRAVFAGTADGGEAFDSNGSFVGDEEQVARTLGRGERVIVNTSGLDAFGIEDVADPLNGNTFQVLEAVASALEAGDVETARTGIDKLDEGHTRITTALGRSGAVASRVEAMAVSLEDDKIVHRQQLSQLEDVDLAQAMVELTASQVAYEASLATIAQANRTSLLDFLR
jgi:flagellar hook-associated protein 3 FlgL